MLTLRCSNCKSGESGSACTSTPSTVPSLCLELRAILSTRETGCGSPGSSLTAHFLCPPFVKLWRQGNSVRDEEVRVREVQGHKEAISVIKASAGHARQLLMWPGKETEIAPCGACTIIILEAHQWTLLHPVARAPSAHGVHGAHGSGQWARYPWTCGSVEADSPPPAPSPAHYSPVHSPIKAAPLSPLPPPPRLRHPLLP